MRSETLGKASRTLLEMGAVLFGQAALQETEFLTGIPFFGQMILQEHLDVATKVESTVHEV